MSDRAKHVQRISWPASNPTADPQAVLLARPFGVFVEDLDIDFENTQRPFLITQLLEHCLYQSNGDSFAEADLWEWTLNRRLQGLLAIGAATMGTVALLRARCSSNNCGEELELPVELEMFKQDFKHDNDPEYLCCKPDGGTRLQLRLPTGRDQFQWLSYSYDDSEELAISMATTLVSRIEDANFPKAAIPQERADWRLPQAWLDSVADTLSEADPMTAMNLHSKCPVCQEDNEIQLDLEAWLLQQLADEQAYLLRQVHRLASVYHWSEAQIVSLPAQRRNEYLTLINESLSI